MYQQAMASNIASRCWRVKVTSLHPATTSEQLAQMFQLSSSRICIPRNQSEKTYYAWINGFHDENDAKKFVNQHSHIKCSVIGPREDNTNNQSQSRKNVIDIPSVMSVKINSSSQKIEGNESQQNSHKSNQRSSRRPSSVQRGPMVPVQVQKQTIDAEYERKFCPFANKGTCRYKDGECKYRHTKCQNYDSCLQADCALAHARRSSSVCRSKLVISGNTNEPLTDPRTQCINGLRCYKADCQYKHPEGWSACKDSSQCNDYNCNSNHPPGRKKKCRDGDQCTINNCVFLHPNMHANEFSTNGTRVDPIAPITISPSEVLNDPAREQSTQIMELDGAQQNFLEFFGDRILDKIRSQLGIKDVKVKDSQLQLTGNRSAITDVKSDLKQAFREQNLQISCTLKKYLESTCKGRLIKKFLQKYRVGISYLEISTGTRLNTHNAITSKIFVKDQSDDNRERKINTDSDVDQSEDEQEDDNDDGKSDISNTSSNISTAHNTFRYRHNHPKKFVQVTLCSDSKDLLSKAIEELQSYSLHNQSWALTQEEVAFILKQPHKRKQPPKGKKPQKNNPIREQSFQMKDYLNGIVQSGGNSIVHVFVSYRKGIWHVKVSGFKDHVKNAVSKIKTWLSDNVPAEVKLPISKVMAIFLRTKAAPDVKKLEKTECIKITVPPRPSSHKNVNDEQDDENDCLKLNGSNSRIRTAQENVENFLESLSEQETHFPCQNWNVSKDISQLLCTRLKKMQISNDYNAIGWIKFSTAVERRETTPTVTVSIVGFNEEAVNDVLEQCEDTVEGYVIWKPSKDEYNAIVKVLKVKKSPSLDEFQQQWETEVQLDREKGTITIPARSKMLADDIKEALLNLGEEMKPRMDRISEFIAIPSRIRRFVYPAIGSLLDEAKSKKIFVDSKTRNGLTLRGRSEIVIDFKEKINAIIEDINQRLMMHPMELSSVESDLIRSNAYELSKRIERETSTIIRDVKRETTSFTMEVSDNDINLAIITVVNDRSQTIAVEKGDITKAKNVDAIVNPANGALYHAGGVDKAIADAAGCALNEECKRLIAKNGGLPFTPGKAVKTTAGNLPFKCVIHAIGPQYVNGYHQERPLLFSSVMKSLQLAENEGYGSIALPAISSKTYGFPVADCTNIVVLAIKQFFADYPQSKVRKVILLDLDDTACNSFAREVAADHSSAVLNDDEDIMNCELPPVTAKWTWQDDRKEKIYNDNHIRQIESAFQQYLKTSVSSPLTINPDNLKSGTIVNYSIHFLANLKQLVTNNRSALSDRLECGYQMREDSKYQRKIFRYPVVMQQQSQTKSVNYCPKQLDSYHRQAVTNAECWNIIGITSASVEQAQKAIREAIHSATVTEPFSVNLNKDLDDHKKELVKIAMQQQIQINFKQDCSGQVSMTLKGLRPNISEAKLKIALYSQDTLQQQVESDEELCIPKEWSDQNEGCVLVEIDRNDPTFTRIENRMKETISDTKINKIERVQNIRMWNHYAFRRRELKKELSVMPNLQIEMELFHGTKNTLPSEIYNGEYGFDMTFSTSGMWGIGTYFAKNASYSCNGYAHKLSNGQHQVFLAQVLTGDVYDCKSDSSLRRPPKKNATISGLRYNSVSGDTGGSKVYIVYENRVAYPAYLITFSK